MRIRMLDSHSGLDFSYGIGQVVDAPSHIAKDLIRGGAAVEVGEDDGRETATAAAPEHAVARAAPVKKAGKKKKAPAAGR